MCVATIWALTFVLQGLHPFLLQGVVSLYAQQRVGSLGTEVLQMVNRLCNFYFKLTKVSPYISEQY